MSRPGQSYEPILEGWSVASVVAEICQRAGVPFDRIDPSLIEGYVDGFGVTNRGAAFSAIQSLSDIYQFDASSFDGALRFIPRGEPVAAELVSDDALDDVTDERDDRITVPVVSRLVYYDTDGGLSTDVQTSDRSLGERTISEAKTETTVIMRADDAARACVIAHKVRAEDARGTRKLELPLGWMPLVPADVVRIDGQRMRVEAVEVDEVTVTVTARYDRASAYETSIAGVPPGEPSPAPNLEAARSRLDAFELPVLADELDGLYLYAAVTPETVDWQGAEVELSRDGGQSWPVSATTEDPVVMGQITAGSAAVRSAYLLDTVSELTVELVRGDMELLPATLADMMNRANRALIGDELVTFGRAEQVGPTTWVIGDLLRGRRGTTIAAHGAGDRFVLLEDVLPAQVQLFDLGRMLDLRATSYTRDGVDATDSLRFTGESQRECAPAYLRARRVGGDLVVSWQGVGRLGGGARVGMGRYFEGFRVTLGATVVDTTASTVAIPYAAGTLQVQQRNSITGPGPAAALEV